MGEPEADALLEILQQAASMMERVRPEKLTDLQGNEVVGLCNRMGNSRLYLKCLSKAANLLKPQC